MLCYILILPNLLYEAETTGNRHGQSSPTNMFSANTVEPLLLDSSNVEMHGIRPITVATFSGHEPRADSANPASQWRGAQRVCPKSGFRDRLGLSSCTLMHLRVGRRGLRHPTPEAYSKAEFTERCFGVNMIRS